MKIEQKNNMGHIYYVYRGNETNDFTLILGGGPHTSNKKYIDKFSSEFTDKNFILIEYSYNNSVKREKGLWDLLSNIELIINNFNNLNIVNFIGFSFGSFVGIHLLNKYFSNVKTAVFSGFLYKYSQLDSVYKKYQEKANEEGETIDKEIRDLYLMGVDREYRTIFKTEKKDKELQEYFEDNLYFEFEVSKTFYMLRKNKTNIKYVFCQALKDDLTPYKNIIEYIKEIGLSGKDITIITKDIAHSLSGFSKEIGQFI